VAHVLIVEDDPDIASLLRRGLAGAGYGAEWAETAEAALARVEAGGVDAAIIDMMLGSDSGAELLAEMRRRGHRMRALMLSALSRVEDRAEGLDAGAQDYIVKPFQLSELMARLAVQLRRAAPRQEPLRLGGLAYDPVTRTRPGGRARCG
jgi:DNA-binding response OmpR family regulator